MPDHSLIYEFSVQRAAVMHQHLELRKSYWYSRRPTSYFFSRRVMYVTILYQVASPSDIVRKMLNFM